MSEIIKVTYDGVEITYEEYKNSWEFELRGRARSAASLKLAKEAIDKPAPKNQKQFVRTKAYMLNWTGVTSIEITSLAENENGHQYVWTLQKKGSERRKEGAELIVVATPENEVLIAEYAKLGKEIERAQEEQRTIAKGMERFTAPKDLD